MMKPLGDRVLVERMDPDEKTAAGIIIPDTAKEAPQQGKVIAVGVGMHDKDGKLVPLDVKAGDRVLFSKFGGTDVQLDGKDYLILRESDVLGILS